MKTRASTLIAIATLLWLPLAARAAELPLVTLTWGPVSAAANYTLYWGTTSRNYTPYPSSNTVATPQTNYTVGVLPGMFYYFAVAAGDSNNNQSSLSPEIFYAPAPTNLVVSYPPGGGNTLNVSWSPIGNAASYQLSWGLQSGNYSLGQQSFAAPQTSGTISGLLPNHVYYFAVAATDANGNQSTNSAEAVLPGNLVVSPGGASDSASVTWGTVANAGSYSLYWGTASGNYTFSNNASTPQTTVSGLAQGGLYYFALNAIGASGAQSGFSPEVVYSNAMVNSSPTTNSSPTNATPTITLANPQNLEAMSLATNGVPGVALTWNAVGGAGGYGLFWGTNTGAYNSSNSSISQTSFVLTNLESTNDYYFAVMALGGTGTNNSGFSPELVYLAAPASFSVTATTNGGLASWSPVAGAANYTVFYGKSSGAYGASASCAGSQTNLSVTSFVASNSYYVVVAAIATNGNQGAYSTEVSYNNTFTNVGPQTNTNTSTNNLTTNQLASTAPSLPPCAVAVTPGTAANSVSLTWGADTDASLASYTLFWGPGTTTNGAYSLTSSLVTTQTNAAVTGLVPNQGYVFQVYAFDANHTQLNFADAVGYFNPAAPVAPPPPSAPPTPSFPPSTNQIPGIPPLLGLNFGNQQANLVIAGTVGAQMIVQSTTNISDPNSWVTIATNTLTQPATGSNTAGTNALPALLQAAFAPALQVYSPPTPNGTAPAQFYRTFMPYDYATLAYQVLASNYPTRLIGVIMTAQSNNVCYVTNQYNYIFCESQTFNVDVQSPSGSTIRQIANSLSSVLSQNWSLAYELGYSNGVYQLLATVVQTDPGSDQAAGQQPPSNIQIDF